MDVSKANAIRKSSSNRIVIVQKLAVIISFLMLPVPVLAGFANSSTNYLPSISDVYVCNVDDGTVSILNGETGELLRTISLPTDARPFGIAFTPKNNRSYITDNGNGNIYFTNRKKVKQIIDTPANTVGPIAMHPGGNFAYISSSSGLLVLDTDSKSPTFNTVIRTITLDWSGSIVFTPDGTRAYISLDGNYGSVSQIKVMDCSTHSVVATLQLPIRTAPLGIACSNDGKRVYVTGWVAHNLSVIDSDPTSSNYNTVIDNIQVGGSARSVVLTPSGDRAYVSLDSGGVDVICTTPESSDYHTVLTQIPDAGTYGGIHDIATSLDGRFIYVSSSSSHELVVIDSLPLSDTFDTVTNIVPVGQTPLGIGVIPH